MSKKLKKNFSELRFSEFKKEPEKHYLSELLTEIIDYRGKTPPKSSSGITLISAANIQSGSLDFSRREYISPEDYQKWITRGLTKSGDILFTTEAPAGEVALYPNEGLYQISRRVIALRSDLNKLQNYYLFYLLQSPQIKRGLLEVNRGSTVPRLLKTDITGLKLSVPSIEEQEKIASFLGAMDARLTKLRRKHELLQTYKRMDRFAQNPIPAEGWHDLTREQIHNNNNGLN